MKKIITIVTPTYNEVGNIDILLERIFNSIKNIDQYRFEILIIDNFSTDGTREKLRYLASNNKSIKIIFNVRNFGHIRSPYYGILQSNGDATIYLASDLQDPPELIPKFIQEWEHGFKLVMAIKPNSKSGFLMHSFRKIYYKLIDRISDVSITRDSTGFGLYDKVVIEHLRQINDPYPFLRGLICELGYEIKTIPFEQMRRFKGVTKNNFYTLLDIALLGIISHSKVPIRLAIIIGISSGVISLFLAFIYLILKLFFWYEYPLGSAPLIIGVFFFMGLQLLFIGIIGEYISSIHGYVQNRPIVIEQERINFD